MCAKYETNENYWTKRKRGTYTHNKKNKAIFFN